MDLQKFGIKLFLNANKSYAPKDFIPVFHSWIQDKAIDNHLLIDVADYSHIPDGPGIMLIAHEGHFSLDQENYQPGIMYIRKSEIDCDFKERFMQILKTTIQAANCLRDNNINKEVNFLNNTFRFISNDRLIAENTLENQSLYQDEIKKVLDELYPDNNLTFSSISTNNERLAFNVNLDTKINILDKIK